MTMGAVKEMIMGLGEVGRVMADPVAVAAWERATGTTVEVADATVDVRGEPVTVPTITAAEARRLLADKRLPEPERDDLRFSMEVAGIDPNPGCCPRCGSDNVTFMVDASFVCGRFHVVNADEPEGPTVHGNAFCEECADVCDATFPDWTLSMRDDALAAYASPVLREALIQLHRAAVSAGLSAPAVDLAAATLRSVGFDVARGKMTYQR
jgi:hypothetical protein